MARAEEERERVRAAFWEEINRLEATTAVQMPHAPAPEHRKKKSAAR